jgi:Bacterial Ig-like domain
MSLIRIGGARMDMYPPSDADLQTMVTNIRAMHAEPLIQIPRSGYFKSPVVNYNGSTPLSVESSRSLPDAIALATRWVRLFNAPGSPRRVRYWSIGNELRAQDPRSSDAAQVSRKIHEYFLPLAAAMKAVDPNIEIFGPDEAWLDSTEHNLLFGYAKDGNGNSYDISGQVPNHRYYFCDGLSMHMYHYPGPGTESELRADISQYRGNYQMARDLVANHPRNAPGSLNPLLWGIGEFNIGIEGGNNTGNTFMNGQLFADTFGWAGLYGATYATSWSICESGFGLFQGAGNVATPSFWHTQMMANNFTGQMADLELSTPDGTALIDRVNTADPAWRAHANVDVQKQQVALIILNHSANPINNVTVYDKRNQSVTGPRIGLNFAGLVPGGSVNTTTTCALGPIPAYATVLVLFSANQSSSTVSKSIFNRVDPGVAITEPTPVLLAAATSPNPWPIAAFPAQTATLLTDVRQLFVFAGSQASVGVKLSKPPTGSVVVTIQESQTPHQLSIPQSTATFDATSWNTYQWVNLGAPVNAVGGNTVTLRVSASGCPDITLPVNIETQTTVSVPTPPAPAVSSTTSATPVVSGTTTQGAVVEIYDGVTLLDSTTATGSGTWSWSPSTPLAQGTHALNVVVTISTGQSSPRSGSTTLTVDTIAPTTPAKPSTSSLTSATPTLSGTSEASATITIYDGTVVLATVAADASGAWTWTVTPALTQGSHSLAVTATDAAGNTSASSPAVTVTVADTTPPAKPAAPTVTNLSSATPTLSGTTEANATITIYDGTVLLATVAANASGAWSWTVTPALTIGSHPLSVTATDAAGNTSASSPAVTVTVADTTTLAKPAAPTVSNLNSSTPTLSGNAMAGATMTIFDGNSVLGTTTADASGGWSWTVNPGLSPGAHILTVTAQDPANHRSPASDPVTVNVAGNPPPGPTTNSGSSGSGCGAGSNVAFLFAAMLVAGARQRWCARSKL